MPVTIPIINDDTNEALEGLYLLVTINTVESNPTDVANAVVLRNGVALVRITDDDGKVYFNLHTQAQFDHAEISTFWVVPVFCTKFEDLTVPLFT